VVGDLVIRKRERDGVTHTNVEVTARSVEFLSPRREPASQEGAPANASTTGTAPDPDDWSDIPF